MTRATKASLILLSGVFVLLSFDGFIIGTDVALASRMAKSQFPGKRVDALIALVECRSCDRLHRDRAVWALGQLDDSRALPVLQACNSGTGCGDLDRETLRIALRHLRHQDSNRSESFLWRWTLADES